MTKDTSGEYFPVVYKEEVVVPPASNQTINRIPFLNKVLFGSAEYRALDQFVHRIKDEVVGGTVPELNLHPGKWKISFSRIRGGRTQIVVLDYSPAALRSSIEYYLSAKKEENGNVSIEVRKVNPKNALS